MSSTTQDIELGNNHADAAGSAGLAPPEEPVHWQRRYSPRITVVRLLSSIVPLGLCIAKAVSVAEGQSALPNTLDWIISVIWGLVAYWLNVIEMEEAYPEWAECLFKEDLTSSMEFWLVLLIIPRFMWFYVYFTVLFSAVRWMPEDDTRLLAFLKSDSAIACVLLGLMQLDMIYHFSLWATSWISTYAGWPNNLKYTARIQSTVEYTKAVSPHKRDAIKIIELLSWWFPVCLRIVMFEDDSWLRGNHWGSVKMAMMTMVLMTLASTPFFLFALYMSAPKSDR